MKNTALLVKFLSIYVSEIGFSKFSAHKPYDYGIGYKRSVECHVVQLSRLRLLKAVNLDSTQKVFHAHIHKLGHSSERTLTENDRSVLCLCRKVSMIGIFSICLVVSYMLTDYPFVIINWSHIISSFYVDLFSYIYFRLTIQWHLNLTEKTLRS